MSILKDIPRALLIIMACGLVLRMIWAALIPVGPVSDSYAYDHFARMMLEHDTYGWEPGKPTAYWPVGTSAIVAGLYALFGMQHSVVVVFNILLSTALIPLTYLAALRFTGQTASLIAAALISFWPSLIMFVSVIASEPIFLFFMLAGFILFTGPNRYGWLLGGLFWAAACYIRPIALLLPFVLAFAAVARGTWTLSQAVTRVAGALVVMAVLITPWTLRNIAAFGKPVMISTNFGPNLWMGNNPETTGGYQELPDLEEKLPEAVMATRLRQEATEYILSDPAGFLIRTIRKAFMLHERETIAIAWNNRGLEYRLGNPDPLFLKIIATGYWYLVLAGALAGLAVLSARSGTRMVFHPFVLVWLYFTGVHAVIVAGDRYHIPAIPFIAMLGAIAATQAWTVLKNRWAAAHLARPN